MSSRRSPSSHERHGGIALGTKVPLPKGDAEQLIEILSSLLSSAPVPAVVLDSDLRIVTYTERASSVFGLSPEDAGHPLEDIPSDLTAENLGDLLRTTRDSGRTIEEDATDRDGRWHRMIVRPVVRGDLDDVTGVVVTLLDIDAERRLDSQTERIELFESAAIRIATELRSVRDPELATQRAISIIAKSLGATGHELVISRNGVWTGTGRKPVEDISDTGALPRVSLPLFGIGGALLGEVRLTFDEPREPLDTPERCFSVRAAEMIARSLEQSQQREALERTMLPLETALHARDEFLGRMSHELRTPLNSVIGFSKVLLKGMGGELTEEQRRQVEMINQSGHHLLALISNLLDLEKIVAGSMPVSVTEFQMADVVDDVVDVLRPVAESKGIELRMAFDGPDVTFESDKPKVRQILLNLVSNAIKFTDAGHVTVSGQASGGTCSIMVEDTGRGMTAGQLEQAFREFEQVDQGPERVKDGTGLGLSIAVRLANLLGGELMAQSESGMGSTFILTLPCRIPDGGRGDRPVTGNNNL